MPKTNLTLAGACRIRISMHMAGRHKTGRMLLVAIAVLILIVLLWLARSRRPVPSKGSPPMHTRSSGGPGGERTLQRLAVTG